jgi:hypothetical protein
VRAASLVLAGGIHCTLAWLAAFRQKNWARLMLFVSFLLAVSLLLVPRLIVQPSDLLLKAATLLSLLLSGVGYWFLFTGDARPWFQETDPAKVF